MGKIAIIVINVRDGDLDQDSIQIEEVFIKTEVEFVVNVKIAIDGRVYFFMQERNK